MATTISLKGYDTATTVLSGASEMNSLAHGSMGAISGTGTGAVLNNATLLDLYADFQLFTGTLGGAPIVGGKIYLYQWGSVDNINYETAPAAGPWAPDLTDPEHLVGYFEFVAAGTSQYIIMKRKPLIPGYFKFTILNMCGQALPATLATVIAKPYNMLNT